MTHPRCNKSHLNWSASLSKWFLQRRLPGVNLSPAWTYRCMAVLGNVMQSTKTNKKVLPSGYCITANTYTGTQTSEQHAVFNRTQTIRVPTFSFQARDSVAELQFPSARRQRQLPGWPQAWLTRPLGQRTAEGEKNKTLECLLKTNFFLFSCELHNREEITDIKQIFLLLTLSLLEPLPEERTLKRKKKKGFHSHIIQKQFQQKGQHLCIWA